MNTKIPMRAEDAVFEVEDIRQDAGKLVERVRLLVQDLTEILPKAQGNDVGGELDRLAGEAANLFGDRIDRIRDLIMSWGVPCDEVGCERCGSPDYSNQACPSCSETRSDGLRISRRLAGWMI